MFPFHTLPFTPRLVMVDPCFVASDDTVQEGVTFIIVIQILLADIQKRLFMHYVSCFGTHLAQTLRKPSLLWMIS